MTHVFVIDTGGQTTISGSGKIYEDFKASNQILGYFGFGQNPKFFYEPGYLRASVRYMNLDETYHRMPYDCTKSMLHYLKLKMTYF